MNTRSCVDSNSISTKCHPVRPYTERAYFHRFCAFRTKLVCGSFSWNSRSFFAYFCDVPCHATSKRLTTRKESSRLPSIPRHYFGAPTRTGNEIGKLTSREENIHHGVHQGSGVLFQTEEGASKHKRKVESAERPLSMPEL